MTPRDILKNVDTPVFCVYKKYFRQIKLFQKINKYKGLNEPGSHNYWLTEFWLNGK